MILRYGILLTGVLWLAANHGLASEEGKASNPLAGLPSAPGPHIKKIKALADNQWLELGQARPDAKWGLACGRAYSSKMAYAQDLGGAFFCGTGRHGAVKPDGHYMDDLWFYDANAHAWICLYPGAGKETRLRLDKHGFEVNEAGDPIPVSYLSHAYNNTTYNTHLRKYMLIHTQCPWWTKAVPQRWEWLDQKYEPVKKRAYGSVGPIIANIKHPWFYDVARAKWERNFVEGAGPNSPAGKEISDGGLGNRSDSVLEYLPHMKKAVFFTREVWFYDYGKNTWEQASAESAKVPDGLVGDKNGCYDPKRERIYLAKDGKAAFLDLKTLKWTEIKAEGQPADFGRASSAAMSYDTAHDVVLIHKSDRNTPRGTIYVYDPGANRWTAPENRFPTDKRVRGCLHGFYSTELNACFYYFAPDSWTTDGTMFVYRYRR